jgi:hypothetical protein
MNNRIYTAEYTLLFSCINHFVDSLVKLELYDSIIEDDFLTLIERHRIAPVIYHVLKSKEIVSSQGLQKLKHLVELNLFRSMSAKREMISFLKFSISADHKLLFLKGLILSEMYYGDISLRHTMDLDVWVEIDSVEASISYLNHCGYVSSPEWSKLSDKQKCYFKKAFHDLSFSHRTDNSRIPIELHWRLREGNGHFTYDPDKEWEKMQQISFGNNTIHAMNEIDLFLYLTVHGTEHAWFRLKWLVDLPVLISKSNLDWKIVIDRAIFLKCEKHLYITILLLNTLLGFEIPRAFHSMNVDGEYRSSVDYIVDRIVSDQHFNANDMERWKTLAFNRKLAESGNNDMRFLLKYFTNPNDWKTLKLPDSIFFLYFPLRPFLFLYRRLFRS